MKENNNESFAIKLSVIVPIYNVEPYLSACMESLLSLQSDDIEYICVLGKSTDRSTEVLREYAARDNRIVTLEQQDIGLSEARNLGTAKAKGEYLLYADSDDFVRPLLFRSLFYTIQENPQEDVFVTDYCMVTVHNGVIREKPINQIKNVNDKTEGIDFLPEMLKKKKCFWNVWRYVYRRSFVEKKGITFRNGSMCEDVDFTTRVLMSEPKIMFLHCPFYCYRVARADSQMGHTTSRRIHDTITVLRDSIQLLENSKFKWKQELIEQYQFEFVLTMAQLYEIPADERENVALFFKKNMPVLKIGNNKIAKTIFCLYSVTGISLPARVLEMLKRIKRGSKSRWRIRKTI